METTLSGTDFLTRNRGGRNCADKDGSRLFVFDHFRRNRKIKQMSAYLGLPGANWVFERDLATKYPCMKIIGVERNFGVLNDGLFNMPANTESTKFGRHKRFAFARRGTCSVIHGELHDVARSLPSGFSCGWLDMHCPVSESMVECVSAFIEKTDDRIQPVPLSVTMLVGREQPPFNAILESAPGDCPAERRAQLLAEVVNQKRLKRTMQPILRNILRYRSEGGALMAVVNFKLVNQVT